MMFFLFLGLRKQRREKRIERKREVGWWKLLLGREVKSVEPREKIMREFYLFFYSNLSTNFLDFYWDFIFVKIFSIKNKINYNKFLDDE